MGKTWMCLAIFAIAVGVIATQSDNEGFVDYEENYDDTWYNDELFEDINVDNSNDEHVVERNSEEISVREEKKSEASDPDLTDQKVENEIDKYFNENVENIESAEKFADDYQIEDNRDKEEVIINNGQESNQPINYKQSIENTQDVHVKADKDFVNDEIDVDDSKPLVETLEETDNLLNENAILEENADKEEKIYDKPLIEGTNELSLSDAIEETNRILEEIDSPFDDDEELENTGKLNKNDGDTDVNPNLLNVLDMMLSEDPDYPNGETKDEENNNISNEKVETIVLSEDVNDFNENSATKNVQHVQNDIDDSVAKVYDDLNEDLDKLSEVIEKLQNDNDVNRHVADNVKNEEENKLPYDEEQQQVDYEELNDDNISKLFEEFNPEEENEYENQDEAANDFQEILTQNEINIDKKSDDLQSMAEDNQSDQLNLSADIAVNENEPKKPDADSENINKVQYLTSQEVEAALDDIDEVGVEMLAMDCDGNVGPMRKFISADEPLEITSCSYPNPYPTGKIMEWIFTGEGRGIEINVTDFSVNGEVEDYLLVKPGQEDASGIEGFVITNRLTTERKYRYLNVDRMFVRFVANEGPQTYTGFKFSIKMIAPLPNNTEELPEPEPIMPAPTETVTLYIGGLGLMEFHEIKEDFKQLVADMAARYIEDNDINPGINTTSETTTIVSSSVCNLNWPDFETCVEVKVAVPLVYDDEDIEPRLNQEDLETMWNDYKEEEEFAARLKNFGISEYAVPNDGSVLLAWLIIGAGFVISGILLSFALWRYSCIDHYTRMPAFNDTDSYTNEKRRLDLYPTPHQTLPPLYSDVDKWDDAVRVDIGGVPNKSYARDDLYSLESDDEDVSNVRHDGFTTDV